MDSPSPIATLDPAGLEAFQTELIRRGFEPLDPDRARWVGPLSESLTSLTDVRTMTLRFLDGRPFEHPRLIVSGIDLRHVGATGEVCLWRPGEASDESITAEGSFARIDEWVERTQKGFRPEDFALDAHLSFGNPQAGVIATVDLSSLGLNAPRHIGDISADWNEPRTILDIRSGHSGSIEGRCYLLSDVLAPPREFEGLRALLAANQQNNFDSAQRAFERKVPSFPVCLGP